MRVSVDKAPDAILREKLDQLTAPILDLLGVDAKDLVQLTITGTKCRAIQRGRTTRGKLLPDLMLRISVSVVDE